MNGFMIKKLDLPVNHISRVMTCIYASSQIDVLWNVDRFILLTDKSKNY